MNEIFTPAAMKKSVFSRRRFLVASAGASLMFGFLRPEAALADGAAPAMFEPTIWYSIDGKGLVTVSIAKAEMGQHVGTALARIVADELETDWANVRLDYVDSDPKWGVMVTGGSWSVNHSFAALSQAGAAGRVTLIAAGAKLMNRHPDACIAQNGAVVAGEKVISFGDIITRGNVSRMFTADELAKLPIKAAGDRHLIGFDTPALDIPDKTNGSTVYGIDAEIPGMVFARPKIPPTRIGAKVISIDDSAAKNLPGYVSSLALNDPSGTVPGWVMVFAETYPAAIQAADLVKVSWTPGETAGVSEQDILDHGTALIAEPGGALVVNDPGVSAAFANAQSTLEQTYTTASVLHFQLEPLNALAVEKDGIFEIHCGNQWQSLILPVLAQALGVGQDKILLRTYLLGGGFGRRLNGDYAVPAALAAQALGKPVKMVCTRADDARFDSIRSPSVQTLRMAFGPGGKVSAMTHDAAAGWPTQVIAGPALLATALNGALYDPFAISGADHWYNVGAHRVRAISNDLANRTFRPGWLRSVGPGWTNWAVESFMDEAAQHARMDPVAFRLAMLDGSGGNAGVAPNSVGGALRQANVLRLAAAKAGWGSAMPADTGLGIATTFGQERTMPTWVACAARVRIDRATGLVTLEKLTLVVDAGTIIHPDGALAQVQGGALWGASMALHEGTEIAAGQVADTNLDSYTPLRMGDVPDMDITFVDSTEFPTGLGEPATTVVAPAIGNAIFAAAGIRLRHLPIQPEAVRAALALPS
jgi:CO/xanthine dehydrogenase Mo-binding subunit